MILVEIYERIRYLHEVVGLSQRDIARQLEISRNTVRKYCRGGALPVSGPRSRTPSVMKPEVVVKVEGYLADDLRAPAKQRHTAWRIYERLRQEEEFVGSYGSVANLVRELRGRVQEAFVPLEWLPGDAAQVDWGEAYFDLAHERVKGHLFCVRLCHSCMPFVAVFPAQRTDFFLEGHRMAFEFLDGVPRRMIYDNVRTAVQSGWGRFVTQKQRSQLLLEAHYVFQSDFCNPGAAHEKGLVEGLVGWTRRNVLTPVPLVDGWEQLQQALNQRCLDYRGHHIRGHELSVGEAFLAERSFLSSLPELPLETSRTQTAVVRDDCLVRMDNSFYSVPARLVGERVTVQGYAFHVDIYAKGEQVAHHERSFVPETVSYRLEHYIDVLERKPRAVLQARPVRRTVDARIQDLRPRLPADAKGDREFVSILRLVVVYGQEAVLKAINACSATQAYTYEAIRFELLQQLQRGMAVANMRAVDSRGPAVQLPDLRLYDKLT